MGCRVQMCATCGKRGHIAPRIDCFILSPLRRIAITSSFSKMLQKGDVFLVSQNGRTGYKMNQDYDIV